MKLAFVFPGQGAQYVGMGKSFYDTFNYVKDYYDRANEVLGYDLKQIIFNGPEEDLTKTENTQPAILLTSIVMWEVVKRELGIEPFVVAGHSLGEYSALVVAGAISFEDAVFVVHNRGKLMQKAVPVGVGAMAAIKKAPKDLLLDILSQAEKTTGKVVRVANYNSDEQIVISGHKEAVDEALVLLKQNKIRGIPLKVSAPFHSPLMEPIVEDFKKVLDNANFKENAVPYIANVDAKLYENAQPSIIKENLLKQIPGSVLWTQTLYTMKELGINKALEIGPGKVLTGLSKKTMADIDTISLDVINVENLKEVREWI